MVLLHAIMGCGPQETTQTACMSPVKYRAQAARAGLYPPARQFWPAPGGACQGAAPTSTVGLSLRRRGGGPSNHSRFKLTHYLTASMVAVTEVIEITVHGWDIWVACGASCRARLRPNQAPFARLPAAIPPTTAGLYQ